MKVLCQVAPWSIDFLHDIACSIAPNIQIYDFSGFKNLTRLGLSYYYSIIALKEFPTDISAEDLEIISRCRLMRSLKLDLAIYISMPYVKQSEDFN